MSQAGSKKVGSKASVRLEDAAGSGFSWNPAKVEPGPVQNWRENWGDKMETLIGACKR
jgi:hypothetical protein